MDALYLPKLKDVLITYGNLVTISYPGTSPKGPVAYLNSQTLGKLLHSVPKGPKSGRASLKTRKGRAPSKPREGLVQGKKINKLFISIIY
jgi:hypothetical protein